MPMEMEYRFIDLTLFGLANTINLLLAAMFVSRARGHPRRGKVFGMSAIALGLPVAAIGLLNLLAGRPWWTVALPAAYAIFALVEWILDYVLRSPFRESRLLWLYLALYYVAVLALVGYGFGLGIWYGFVTLGTYFLCLGATWYSYARVGHGTAQSKGSKASE